MPRGLKRFHHTGQSHFVTFCCYHRRRLLATDESRRIFESALERVRRRFKLYVYGYVVMPEHVHLLLSEPQWDRSSDRIDPLKPKDGLNGPPVIRSALCSCKLHHRRLLVHRVNVFRKSCRDHCPHVFGHLRRYPSTRRTSLYSGTICRSVRSDGAISVACPESTCMPKRIHIQVNSAK
jgi:hypothetical protein